MQVCPPNFGPHRALVEVGCVELGLLAVVRVDETARLSVAVELVRVEEPRGVGLLLKRDAVEDLCELDTGLLLHDPYFDWHPLAGRQ